MSQVELERVLPANRHGAAAIAIVRFACCGRKGACAPSQVPERARCWVCEPHPKDEA